MKAQIGAIFDLDGTLIDSFDQIADCCLRVRNTMKMKSLSKKELTSLIGLPVERLFSDNPTEVIQTAVKLFRIELSKEIERENHAFEGAYELLNALKQQGVGIAVATSKPHPLALKVIDNSSLKEFVDCVQGIDGFAPKPDPEVVIRCQNQLLADKFVMLGDRPEDIEAGLRSGCYSVGIAQGVFGESQLKKAGAQETYESLVGLLDNLESFLSRLQSYGD